MVTFVFLQTKMTMMVVSPDRKGGSFYLLAVIVAAGDPSTPTPEEQPQINFSLDTAAIPEYLLLLIPDPLCLPRIRKHLLTSAATSSGGAAQPPRRHSQL